MRDPGTESAATKATKRQKGKQPKREKLRPRLNILNKVRVPGTESAATKATRRQKVKQPQREKIEFWVKYPAKS